MKKKHKKFSKQHPRQGTVNTLVRHLKAELNKQESVTDMKAKTSGKERPAVGTETRLLIDMLEDNYDFRFNTITGCTELRSKNTDAPGWQQLDERMLNSLTMEARLQGVNVWTNETRRYLLSMSIADYNPIEHYLSEVRGKWDGQDHIGRLTASVSTTNTQWTQWMRRWLMAMVAQWMGLNRAYGNAVAPLLVAPQGYHKSTFCRRLLPPELQWGYADCLVVSEKRQMLQAMSQLLLINLDEFNQISRKTQEGFVKNIMQVPVVKARRPYGRRIEDLPRLASFIATSNMTDLLTDPSGSRRFFVVEVNKPVDVSFAIDHTQLYAQIVHLLDTGERYWFDDDESQLIMHHNRQYQQLSPAELYFHELFMPADSEADGQWLTASAIYTELRRRSSSIIPQNGLLAFGRALSQTEKLRRKRAHQGTVYLVKRR